MHLNPIPKTLYGQVDLEPPTHLGRYVSDIPFLRETLIHTCIHA